MGGNAEIFIAGASDRSIGVQRVLKDVDLSVFSDSEIALKANYNSADPPPASTHIDTLDAVCTAILAEKPKKLTLAERSGMGNTRGVLETRGVITLAQDRGFSTVVLDELERTGWREIQAPGSALVPGFFYCEHCCAGLTGLFKPAASRRTDLAGISHMSLKNSVGLIAKRVPGVNYDFMGELHSSPHQRLMIAEINKFYRTDLVVYGCNGGFCDRRAG